jgi:hypothetical protein
MKLPGEGSDRCNRGWFKGKISIRVRVSIAKSSEKEMPRVDSKLVEKKNPNGSIKKNIGDISSFEKPKFTGVKDKG